MKPGIDNALKFCCWADLVNDYLSKVGGFTLHDDLPFWALDAFDAGDSPVAVARQILIKGER